jgi:transposase-like protein
VARRRRWTLEQKLALVEEVSRPGSSVAAVVTSPHRVVREEF